MERLIEDFDIRLIEPGCAPGASRWNALLTLPNDISDIFPYLNALFEGVWYDHDNKTLVWREGSDTYALQPREIRIARVEDPAHARKAASELVERLNRIWQERDSTEPRYTERKPPSVLDVFKLLPQTNRKECGYPTCMAYAAAVSQGNAQPEDCPPLTQPGYSGSRQQIADLVSLL
jgi:ArsR family metal-binding transcriptional regulator